MSIGLLIVLSQLLVCARLHLFFGFTTPGSERSSIRLGVTANGGRGNESSDFGACGELPWGDIWGEKGCGRGAYAGRHSGGRGEEGAASGWGIRQATSSFSVSTLKRRASLFAYVSSCLEVE